ncbi:MAG TPA: hypothetical protein DF296_09245 [Candidatus Margulisbacteria bacterium]|nr:MAG: hypothetical protein A2X43_06860 [Candidatus Margulisbacteria bacterium GWD2_39_127]OGI05261.1 MAG: hypothetical protein A2X42_03625 [Candidatus Margulisbacteria bacterium GWF2_38_17]OGI10880.1 MAG: hypothetical protein A2X41_05850 [Candidatus Margulisbacteria bacterium GWE2_39_32]HAR64254.1 hypothetical protein [Candidatus Margulisiibacteriota bacterium]HCT85372.1 hypothetical protein [Candidatus Margulisiibacteriota bacterium]
MSSKDKPLFDELDIETKASKPIYEAGKKLYLEGAVANVDREKSTLQGKVTENAKVFYPEIIVKFDRFVTNCTCNYQDEPLCPHVVALSMAHIYGLSQEIAAKDQGLDPTYIEQFLYRVRDMFSLDQVETDFIPGFMLDINPKTEMYSLFLYNKKDNSIIAQPETLYHKILNNPYLTKIEKNLINYFVQKEYWAFFAPLNYTPIKKGLTEILTLFSEVTYVNPKTMGKYLLVEAPLKLQFTNTFEEPVLNVSSQFIYHGNTIPFEETIYIEGVKCFLYWDTTFFPVWDDVYKEFLPLLSRNPVLKLTGDQIPIFLGEVLPLIPLDHFEFVTDDNIRSIEVINLKPEVELKFSEKNDLLAITLFFHYQETSIKDSLLSTNKYYYIFNNKKHVYIKKDPFAEKQSENLLINNGFKQAENTFISQGKHALEFLYAIVPSLPEAYHISGISELKKYRINPEPIKMVLNLKKEGNKLLIEMAFSHKDKAISPKAIHTQLAKKDSFIILPDKTFARLPIEDVEKLNGILGNIKYTRQTDCIFEVSSIYSGLLFNNFQEYINPIDTEKDFFDNFSNLQHLTAEPQPGTLNATLRHYQVEGYNWLRFLQKNSWGGILADDMGLGKTLQTLALLLRAYAAGSLPPTLIIVPTSVIFNWERESSKFTPDLKILKYYGQNRHELLAQSSNYHLLFTSYGTVRRDIEILKKYEFLYVIIDEAQNIKNPSSQTASTIKQLRSRHKIALTGTPIENRLTELWSIFDFIMPGFLGNKEQFERTYELFTGTEQQTQAISELKAKVYPFMLRRTKAEVSPELPPKIEDHLYCQMNDQFEQAYKNYLTSLRRDIFSKIEKDGINKHRIDIFTAMLRLRQLCCHPRLVKESTVQFPDTSPKFEAFKSMVREIIAEDHKILVFSQFTEMLALIEKWLIQEDIKFAYLDGATRNRAKAIDSFTNDPERKLFLISLKAGGTGLNLTAADYVIHYDPWWNPAVEAQATDRAYRIGQKRSVFSYKFVTKNTIEEKIISLQEQKMELFQSLFSGEENTLSVLQKEDLEYLFS